MPAITVQYNITYTFSPWGWKMADVSVSNATFHSSASEKAIDIMAAPGGGIVPQAELPRNPDMLTSGWSWWPKKEADGKAPLNPAKPADGAEQAGLGDGPIFAHPAPPQ